MRRLGIITVLVCLGLARPARADLASSIYGDVQDVVQELIEKEVTTSVVGKLKAKSPALGFYLHGTLERLASPYWGSLGRTLKADLTVLISDFVYWHIAVKGGPDGDIVKSAARFFDCAVGTAEKPKENCSKLLDAVQKQQRPLLEVECRRNKAAPENRIACDVGLAVRAALEGRKEVRHHLIDALADIVLQEIAQDRGLTERAQDVLMRWLELKNDYPQQLFDILGNPQINDMLSEDGLEKLCGTASVQKSMTEYFNDPGVSPAWLCFAVTHPNLNDALMAGVFMREKDVPIIKTDPKNMKEEVVGLGTIKTHLDYWQFETAISRIDWEKATEDQVFRVFLDMAMDAKCPPPDPTNPENQCNGVKLAPGAIVQVGMMGKFYVGLVNEKGQIEKKYPNYQPLLPLMKKIGRAHV